MSGNKKYFFILLLFIFAGAMSGCALLQIPGQVIGGTFTLLGKVLQIISKMPMPPPGVF